MRAARTIGAALFVIALPLMIVLTHVRLLVFDASYYARGYERHAVATTTGMSAEQLGAATEQVQAVFRGGPPVSLVVGKEWGTEPLFNAREQQHLADVRDRLGLALRAQEASLVYLLGVAACLLAARRAAGARTLARWVAYGAGLTLALFAGIGLLAVVDFSSFWTAFHVLSFSNDLWMLDPRTDYMIRLWPVPFWFGAVTDVVARSALTAVVLLVAAWMYTRWWGLATAGVALAAAACAPPAALPPDGAQSLHGALMAVEPAFDPGRLEELPRVLRVRTSDGRELAVRVGAGIDLRTWNRLHLNSHLRTGEPLVIVFREGADGPVALELRE